MLKTVYKLKLQFLNTENVLNIQNIPEHNPSVEVIIGKKKFNLNDIVIVEEVKVKSQNYSGFLNNLGKTVSATFVKKDLQYESKIVFEENPIVVIEKKKTLEEPQQNYMSEEDLEDKYTVENIQLNMNELDIANLPDQEQKLFKSALSLNFKCNICQKLYSKRWRLYKHLKTCGKPPDSDTKGNTQKPSLPCPYCKKIFKAKKFLKTHVRASHNIFKCDICNAILHDRNRLAYHKSTRHKQPLLICQCCGIKFKSKNSLAKHLFRHSNGYTPQFICTVCGKTYHYRSGLDIHMTTHTNERKYCCEHCDKKFTTTTAQQRHLRTHTGERPYGCTFCTKTFLSSSERRKHLYIHTGNMPHLCQYCKEGFNSKLNLQRHLMKHLGDFRCEICGKGLVSLEVLKIHFNLRHKEEKKK